MTRPLEQIAREIGNRPLEACISAPFATGERVTVWGDRLTPLDYARLRELLGRPAGRLTDRQRRSIVEADASAERRRRRR